MSLHELIPAITDHLKAQSIKNEIYIEQLWTFTAFSIFRGGPPPPPAHLLFSSLPGFCRQREPAPSKNACCKRLQSCANNILQTCNYIDTISACASLLPPSGSGLDIAKVQALSQVVSTARGDWVNGLKRGTF